MGLNTYSGNNKKFASIVEGTIRVRANEGENGAKQREFENKKTGQKGIKWEFVYESLSGRIEKIEFKDSDYGLMLEIMIDGITLSSNTSSKYGTDIMKKLPEVNLSEPVVLKPYNFVSKEDGKQRSGMTVWQNDKKIPSFFHTLDGTKTKSINGFPIPQGITKEYKKNDWTIFYLLVDKFLVDYTQKNIIPKISNEIHDMESAIDNAKEIIGGEEIETEEIGSQEVPF